MYKNWDLHWQSLNPKVDIVIVFVFKTGQLVCDSSDLGLSLTFSNMEIESVEWLCGRQQP